MRTVPLEAPWLEIPFGDAMRRLLCYRVPTAWYKPIKPRVQTPPGPPQPERLTPQEAGRVDLSDEGLRKRALLEAEKRRPIDGVRLHDPNLLALVAALDALGREPTEEELRQLAWDHYQTYLTAKTAADVRAGKLRGRAGWAVSRRGGNRGGTWQYCTAMWAPEEEDVLKALWDSRGSEPVADFDRRVAAILTGLPLNENRGVRRTQSAVKKRRQKLGLATTVEGTGQAAMGERRADG